MAKRYKARQQVTIDGVAYDFKANSGIELGRKIERKRQEIASDERKISSGITVSKWFEIFMKTYKTNVSHREYLNLKNQFKNHIKSPIGSMSVKDVKPLNCMQIMNSLDGFSKSFASKIRTLLFSMFDAAEDNDLTLKNPARKLKLPNVYQGERRAITDEERKVFTEICKTHEYGFWLMIMLHCGLRPSETARIRGIDFDVRNMSLYIDGTKTKKAKRTIPLPPEILPYLNGVDLHDFKPIFQTSQGNPIDEQRRTRMWKALKRTANIKNGCKVYRNKVYPPFWVAPDLVPDCFRHTYGTDLKAKGIPSSIIADMMGHEETSTTAGYTHASNASFKFVQEKLGRKFAKVSDLDSINKHKLAQLTPRNFSKKNPHTLVNARVSRW